MTSCSRHRPSRPFGDSETNYSMTDAVVPATVDRWLYHFTHVDNVTAIRDAGCLSCDVVARRGMTRSEVGAADIKEARRQRTIPVPRRAMSVITYRSTSHLARP
ncbi:hypothetical protein Asp14428_63560 [Actinoplanes sp. NBRC 14428]|nr:hypothetical protein Asp14428_63560 [Actinoplanes sp. NBRC 14428]